MRRRTRRCGGGGGVAEAHIAVFVDGHVVDDLLGPLDVLQCAQRLRPACNVAISLVNANESPCMLAIGAGRARESEKGSESEG